MESPEQDWYAAFAREQGQVDADVRAEAFDVFVAEAGRGRLVDRTGRGRLRLTSGVTLEGRLTGFAEVADHLALLDDAGRACQIATRALVTMSGTQARLRPEPAPTSRSLPSWLREVWAMGGSLSALDVTGHWHRGRVIAVASDYVDLDGTGSGLTLPYAAVEAWRV